MDPIWLCVLTLLLHLLINRLFGRLTGWGRVVHWPCMMLAAVTAHALLANPAALWLLQLASIASGDGCDACAVLTSLLAAAVAALVVRRAQRRVAGRALP